MTVGATLCRAEMTRQESLADSVSGWPQLGRDHSLCARGMPKAPEWPSQEPPPSSGKQGHPRKQKRKQEVKPMRTMEQGERLAQLGLLPGHLGCGKLGARGASVLGSCAKHEVRGCMGCWKHSDVTRRMPHKNSVAPDVQGIKLETITKLHKKKMCAETFLPGKKEGRKSEENYRGENTCASHVTEKVLCCLISREFLPIRIYKRRFCKGDKYTAHRKRNSNGFQTP